MRMGIEQTRVSGMASTETLDFHEARSRPGFHVVRTWVKTRYPKIAILIGVSRSGWLNPLLAPGDPHNYHLDRQAFNRFTIGVLNVPVNDPFSNQIEDDRLRFRADFHHRLHEVARVRDIEEARFASANASLSRRKAFKLKLPVTIG